MHFSISLTVAESKRLIAKGVVADERVTAAVQTGRLAVLPGTTNGYVIEELIATYGEMNWDTAFGGPFDKRRFVAGRTLPKKYSGTKLEDAFPAVIVHAGTVRIMTSAEAADELGPGDVFIKGVNAINYEKRQSAVLIGHPSGGNLGESLGTAVARRVCYLHPVGLEKNIGIDLDDVARRISSDPTGSGPTLWVVPGPLFTEIEALSVLADVDAVPISAGGVGGAEGAVWLMVSGTPDNLEKAKSVIAAIQGEVEFHRNV